MAKPQVFNEGLIASDFSGKMHRMKANQKG